MKRFKFRLQRVLDYRERIRDEKRQELVRANLEKDEAERKLEELRALALQSHIQDGGTYPASHLMMMSDYHARLKREIALQVVRIEELSKVVETARDAYVEASRDAKSLDTIRAKRNAEYVENALKEEAQSLDEMTVQRYRFGKEN